MAEQRPVLFNLLIQVAIFLRAGLAATARFLKWIGLPVIDAGNDLIEFLDRKISLEHFCKA